MADINSYPYTDGVNAAAPCAPDNEASNTLRTRTAKQGLDDPANRQPNTKKKALTVATFNALCRKSGKKAYSTIVRVMSNENETAKNRLEAAKYLIDRGFGKAEVNRTHTLEAGQTFLQALREINERPSVAVSQDSDGKMKVIEHDPDTEHKNNQSTEHVAGVAATGGSDRRHGQCTEQKTPMTPHAISSDGARGTEPPPTHTKSPTKNPEILASFNSDGDENGTP